MEQQDKKQQDKKQQQKQKEKQKQEIQRLKEKYFDYYDDIKCHTKAGYEDW